jgi:hypothetical protein
MKNKLPEKLELSAETKKLQEAAEVKLEEIKASCCDCPPSICPEDFYAAIRNVYDYLDYRNRYVNESINDLYNVFYTHVNNGHTPALNGEALTKFIKIMGLENTYEVIKKPVFVSASHKNTPNEVVFEFKKSEN